MQRAPGRNLLSLAQRLLSREELDRVIEPAIADLQHEWWSSAKQRLSLQLLVRSRAYVGALRVVGPRLLGAGLRASVEPPSWSLIRHSVLPFLLFWTTVTLVSWFGPAAARTREHWLFYLPDRMLWYVPLLALCHTGYPRKKRIIDMPWLRAGDLARLTAIVCLVCFAWSGWIAPLLRQQYLLSLNLADFLTASVHQWTLPQLIDRLQGTPDTQASVVAAELHMRLVAPALAIVFGFLGWTGVRAGRLWSDGVATTVSFVGLITLVLLLRIGGFATLRLSSERIAAEWLSLAALLALTFATLRWIARIERVRRTPLEARVLELLRALGDARNRQHGSGRAD